jgi:hypothetical protein
MAAQSLPPASSKPSSGAAAGGSGVVAFKLADIGEGIAEVELLKWFVKVVLSVRLFARDFQLVMLLLYTQHAGW